jgi:D-alanine-D-alanine ligase
MPTTPKLKIAVICGGNSTEREVSLLCGQNVFENLDREKYEVYLVEISENLAWFDTTRNLKLNLYSTENGINSTFKNLYDLAFLAMPGTFGEDGQLQSLLEIIGLKYTHSGRLSSALAMDKNIASDLAQSIGLKIPKTFVFNSKTKPETTLKSIQSKLTFPIIFKPNSGGSSVDTFKIQNTSELKEKLDYFFEKQEQIILAQEFVIGREITCPVLGNSNSTQELHVLPVGEILIESEFFDYQAKYFDEKTREVFPAQVDPKFEKEIQRQSKLIHQKLNCDGLSRTDFILTSDNQIYYLETNTNPGMTAQSLCPKAGALEFGSVSNFLDKIIDLALEKYTSGNF